MSKGEKRQSLPLACPKCGCSDLLTWAEPGSDDTAECSRCFHQDAVWSFSRRAPAASDIGQEGE